MVAVYEIERGKSVGGCVLAIACGEVGFVGCKVSSAGRGGVCLELGCAGGVGWRVMVRVHVQRSPKLVVWEWRGGGGSKSGVVCRRL